MFFLLPIRARFFTASVLHCQHSMENSPSPAPQELSREERKAAQAAADRAVVRRARTGKMLRTVGLVVLVLGVMGGLVWLAEGQDSDQPNPIDNTVSTQDHIKGNAEASVTIVEYGDFQCPACAAYAPVGEQLMEEYGDRVRFVFRHFPLKTIHANAVAGSRAAEAAGNQGKFWEMHDILYANQNTWAELNNPTDQFVSFAEALELNVDQFKTDMNSKEVKDRVEADYDSANAAGLSSTPSFFLNGSPINPRSYEDFADLVQNELGE